MKIHACDKDSVTPDLWLQNVTVLCLSYHPAQSVLEQMTELRQLKHPGTSQLPNYYTVPYLLLAFPASLMWSHAMVFSNL